jgi:cytochrome c-type biogenesis protein CcmH/NrfG
MALSMEEQRILAEIEQHLARAEPVLAARMASFSRPGPMSALRSPRMRILASCVALVVVTVVSLIAYALLPLRAMPDRVPGGRATSVSRQPTMTASQRPALKGLPEPVLATLSR